MKEMLWLEILVIIGFVGLFIILDYLAWYLRRKTSQSFSEERGVRSSLQGYSLNLKIWGLGAILGMASLVLFYFNTAFKPDLFADKQTCWQGVILSLGVLSIMLLFVSIIMWAITKIVKED